VALELGDGALGVGLAVHRRVATCRGAHPLASLPGRLVLGGGLRRDQRRRLERLEGGIGVLAGIAPIASQPGDLVAGEPRAADKILQGVGFAAGRVLSPAPP